MKHKSFENMNCSLAQSMEIVGERWSLLIIRDVSFGIRRFDDIQKSLGIARNVLTNRLNRLTEEGILKKTPVESGRMEYRLTDKGWDLQPVLLSLTHWGDKYKPHPDGKRLTFVDREFGKPIQRMAVHAADGRLLKPKEIRARLGPALKKDAQLKVPIKVPIKVPVKAPIIVSREKR
jgi:DNA-binding HxlR family transcriptional regulator